jgi:hypothetical protein
VRAVVEETSQTRSNTTSADSHSKGEAKGKGSKDGKVIKSAPIPVGSSTSIHSAAVNAGVVASISCCSALQTNVSADCVVRAVVEGTSQTRSQTTSADSHSKGKAKGKGGKDGKVIKSARSVQQHQNFRLDTGDHRHEQLQRPNRRSRLPD